MYMSVRLPFGVAQDGNSTKLVSITLQERLLLRHKNLYSLGVILLLSAMGHWFPTTVELGLLLLGLCINMLPTCYRFTTAGVACNNTTFRRWEEFTSVQIKGARLSFIPCSGLAPLKLVLLPSRQQEILPILEHFLKVQEQGPSSPNRLSLSWLRKHLTRRTLQGILLSFALMLVAVILLSACGQPGPDPSGLNIADQQNLTHIVANSTTPATSSNALNQAKTQEPFAYNLALLVDENRLGINFVWTLVTGYLVMFMQLGFLLVEVGFCRIKNAAHTAGMNFMIYGFGMIGYFIAGFAFQFGGVGVVGVPNLGGLSALNSEFAIRIGNVNWGLLGYKGFFLNDGSYDAGIAVMFLFQMVFMDTTAIIPTGALAERWKWSAFCVYGFFVSTLVYPVFGNWAWGGGWLSQLSNVGLGAGYVDFAGSGVVHAVGGWCALAGAIVIGPRIGKYNPDGSANTIPGHNMVLALTGCFILAFGWFGFNPGSTLGASGNGNLRIGIIAVDTMLAGSFGAMTSMIYTWLTGAAKKPDLGMMGNGLLAGLVAITAPSGYVSPVGASIIGAVAGFNVVFFAGLIEKVWKIDDPVGAIAVHGVNGMWGQLSVGLFADGLANYGGLQVRGLFFGDVGQLVAQIIGAVTCFVYVFGISFLFFKAYHRMFGLRVSPQVELVGLDVPELGGLAYPAESGPSLQAAAASIGLFLKSIPPEVWSQVNSAYQMSLDDVLPMPPPQLNQDRPILPQQDQGRPMSPPQQNQGRLIPPQQNQGRPIPPQQDQWSNNPSYHRAGPQPEAWSQNQRNRLRRITFDSDSQ